MLLPELAKQMIRRHKLAFDVLLAVTVVASLIVLQWFGLEYFGGPVILLAPVYLACWRGWKTWQVCLALFLVLAVFGAAGTFIDDIRAGRPLSFRTAAGDALLPVVFAAIPFLTLADIVGLFLPTGLPNFFYHSRAVFFIATIIVASVAAIQGNRRRRWLVIGIGLALITAVRVLQIYLSDGYWDQKDLAKPALWNVITDQISGAAVGETLLYICVYCFVLWALICLFRKLRRLFQRSGGAGPPSAPATSAQV
jgi:hypothetical protein